LVALDVVDDCRASGNSACAVAVVFTRLIKARQAAVQQSAGTPPSNADGRHDSAATTDVCKKWHVLSHEFDGQMLAM
jgi:hypothetical protein